MCLLTTNVRPPNREQVVLKLPRQNPFFSHPLTIILVSVLALVFVGFALVRSPTFIIPPAAPVAPVTVYVVDYGYHSSLILPNGEGRLVEYAYGDWRYFALNQQNLGSGMMALLFPTQGTLGRRRFNQIAKLQGQLGPNGQGTLLSFEVAGAKADWLLEWLNHRFRQNRERLIVNPRNHLSFVPDDQVYTLFHNSNHEVAMWLESLGCQVEGFVMWPNFRVKPSDK